MYNIDQVQEIKFGDHLAFDVMGTKGDDTIVVFMEEDGKTYLPELAQWFNSKTEAKQTYINHLNR